MNKEVLFEFVRTWENRGKWSSCFDAEEAMYDAQVAQLIDEYELVNVDILDERRWGVIKQYTFELPGICIAIDVYEMITETGDDLFQDVYEVEPYEITVTKYKRKPVVEIEVSDA